MWCAPARRAFPACRLAGFEPAVGFVTEDYPAAQGLVGAGIGISAVPRMSLASPRSDVVAVPMARPAARLLGSLSLRVLQLHHLSLAVPGRLDRSLADHQRLLAAYAERDAPLAVAITRSIVLAGHHAVEAALGSAPVSARTSGGL